MKAMVFLDLQEIKIKVLVKSFTESELSQPQEDQHCWASLIMAPRFCRQYTSVYAHDMGVEGMLSRGARGTNGRGEKVGGGDMLKVMLYSYMEMLSSSVLQAMKTKAKQNRVAGLRFNLQHQGKYMLTFSSSPFPLPCLMPRTKPSRISDSCSGQSLHH